VAGSEALRRPGTNDVDPHFQPSPNRRVGFSPRDPWIEPESVPWRDQFLIFVRTPEIEGSALYIGSRGDVFVSEIGIAGKTHAHATDDVKNANSRMPKRIRSLAESCHIVMRLSKSPRRDDGGSNVVKGAQRHNRRPHPLRLSIHTRRRFVCPSREAPASRLVRFRSIPLRSIP